MKDYYTEKSTPGKVPIGILYYATSITSRSMIIAIVFYYVPYWTIAIMMAFHLIMMALPCAIIGSYW